MHGHGIGLCGCDIGPNIEGEIPMLWRRIKKLEMRVRDLEREVRANERAADRTAHY